MATKKKAEAVPRVDVLVLARTTDGSFHVLPIHDVERADMTVSKHEPGKVRVVVEGVSMESAMYPDAEHYFKRARLMDLGRIVKKYLGWKR
jgi:hypothetical protein